MAGVRLLQWHPKLEVVTYLSLLQDRVASMLAKATPAQLREAEERLGPVTPVSLVYYRAFPADLAQVLLDIDPVEEALRVFPTDAPFALPRASDLAVKEAVQATNLVAWANLLRPRSPALISLT